MNLAKVAKRLTALVAGAVAGGGGGVAVAGALMYYEKWQHPEDPSAASVGIIVMLTFPLGLLLGLGAGAWFADRWIKQGNEGASGFDVVKGDKGGQR